MRDNRGIFPRTFTSNLTESKHWLRAETGIPLRDAERKLGYFSGYLLMMYAMTCTSTYCPLQRYRFLSVPSRTKPSLPNSSSDAALSSSIHASRRRSPRWPVAQVMAHSAPVLPYP